MTEREIQLLGFERQVINNDPNWDTYYYYSYNITDGFKFTSNASDEPKEINEWYVGINDSTNIRFSKFEEVQSLINLLTKRIVK